MRTSKKIWLFVGCLAVVCAYAGTRWLPRQSPDDTALPRAATPEADRSELRTAHYVIASYASAEQTAEVGAVVERLHDAYLRFFPEVVAKDVSGRRLQMVLYRDQAQFKANNRSSPWAEAYYRPPTCFAYYAAGQRNPYHWMLHEATHQLHHEVAGFSNVRWMNEGIASYFGASRVVDGVLRPGTVDRNAYPIWWLPSLHLSGELGRDIADKRLIPLRALIDGDGPPIAENVNLYYIEFWSLTHFLFHGEGGRHADAYRRLLAGDGSLEQFEAAIGPVADIERRWYGHLVAQIDAVR